MNRSRPRRQLVLRTLSPAATQGFLQLGFLRFSCAIGRSGLSARKREGDGATPLGRFGLVEVRYRADRVHRPRTTLPLCRLAPEDGWCDAKGDRNYNRYVRHPYAASAERMWREDHLYDIVVVVDHNRRPRVQGAGSAIFIHVARDGFRPTEGCIALKRPDLIRVLARLSRSTRIVTHRQK